VATHRGGRDRGCHHRASTGACARCWRRPPRRRTHL
jgi:hypothetical protein